MALTRHSEKKEAKTHIPVYISGAIFYRRAIEVNLNGNNTNLHGLCMAQIRNALLKLPRTSLVPIYRASEDTGVSPAIPPDYRATSFLRM